MCVCVWGGGGGRILMRGVYSCFDIPSNHNEVILHFEVSHGQLDTTHRSHSLLITPAPIANEINLRVSP